MLRPAKFRSPKWQRWHWGINSFVERLPVPGSCSQQSQIALAQVAGGYYVRVEPPVQPIEQEPAVGINGQHQTRLKRCPS
jgi:hypothetical protein